jgi:hypothetical protein
VAATIQLLLVLTAVFILGAGILKASAATLNLGTTLSLGPRELTYQDESQLDLFLAEINTLLLWQLMAVYLPVAIILKDN